MLWFVKMYKVWTMADLSTPKKKFVHPVLLATGSSSDPLQNLDARAGMASWRRITISGITGGQRGYVSRGISCL